MRSGVLIRESREAAGLTQAELSDRSGVAQSVISQYEVGAREPRADVFLRLVALTGVPLEPFAFTDEDRRSGRLLSDLFLFAEELPHHWPGELRFPSQLWTSP